MDEPEQERYSVAFDRDRIVGALGSRREVRIECGVENRGRDQGFHELRRHRYETERRESQREAVPDRERRDENGELPPVPDPERNRECGHEQDMIVAGEIGNVPKAKFDVDAKFAEHRLCDRDQ